jgi:hypothetical protein
MIERCNNPDRADDIPILLNQDFVGWERAGDPLDVMGSFNFSVTGRKIGWFLTEACLPEPD